MVGKFQYSFSRKVWILSFICHFCIYKSTLFSRILFSKDTECLLTDAEHQVWNAEYSFMWMRNIEPRIQNIRPRMRSIKPGMRNIHPCECGTFIHVDAEYRTMDAEHQVWNEEHSPMWMRNIQQRMQSILSEHVGMVTAKFSIPGKKHADSRKKTTGIRCRVSCGYRQEWRSC